MRPFSLSHRLSCLALACLCLSGCEQEVESPTPAPRPVRVMVIQQALETQGRVLTGVVKPWVDEDISAEVAGRIEFVAQQGTQLEGRWLESGEVVVTGDVLARMDASSYEALVRAAEEEVERARIQCEEVIPARIAQARVVVDRELEDYRKVESSFEKDAASAFELSQDKAALAIARAQLKTVEAEHGAAGAALAVARAQLESAQITRDRAVIYAPFSGEVAKVYREPGGYANPGTPIARLVMMDPILVEATASAETVRGIDTNDIVQVRSTAWDEPLLAKVHHKSTAADPRTLTYTISIITRNPLEGFDGSADVKVVGGIFALQHNTIGKASDLMAPEGRTLLEDDHGYYVWKLEPVDGAASQVNANGDEPYVARRIEVVPGDQRRAFQGIAVTRTLRDAGSLELYDSLAMDPPPDLRDGDLVQIRSTHWVLRPGSVVKVVFPSVMESSELRVPTTAIRHAAGDSGCVFLVREGRAVRVSVQLGPVVGSKQAIVAEDQASLVGQQLVLQGAQYLKDGELVRVVSTEEPTDGVAP